MNKAFIKEPDQSGPVHCPRCGSLGTVVNDRTLAAHLGADFHGRVANPANFCPYPACSVVYFDQFDRVITVEDVGRPVYPKDPEAPMCACFGLTRQDIDDEIAAGSVARLREMIAKAKSAEARCETAAFDGRCCVAEVQRYYMQHRQSAG